MFPFPKFRSASLLGIASPFILCAAANAQPSPQAGSAEAAPPSVPAATANLNITPKRLTLSAGERTATVFIFNRGDSPATFDISVVDRVMLPTGEIKPLDEAQAGPAVEASRARLASAKGMILATPRRATLAARSGQTIRVRITPPAVATASEYRSHLTVSSVPPRDVGFTAEQASSQPDQLSFRVNSTYGVSIPVIIRARAVEATGEILHARLTTMAISADGVAAARPTPVVSLELKRTGANSLYGNVEVRGNEREPLGIARGLGVYTEIDSRSVDIPLRRPPARGERLEIVFVDDDAKPGRLISRVAFSAP